MIAAYVLVQISATDPGKVVEKIRRIEGVKQAHVTTGIIMDRRLKGRPRKREN